MPSPKGEKKNKGNAEWLRLAEPRTRAECVVAPKRLTREDAYRQSSDYTRTVYSANRSRD